jgi:hypothetical protein
LDSSPDVASALEVSDAFALCGSFASFSFQRLDVHVAAKELARRVHLAGTTRAAKSAFLCLAEGLPNDGPAMRR